MASSSSPRIGFLGTGIMGKPMIGNLLRRGFPVALWNRTASKCAGLVAAGATAPGTPRAVAEQSEILIAMLFAWEHLAALLDGPDGILAALRPGSIFIDMGTDPPARARELAAAFGARGIESLDAPVSGGERGAIEGSLAIMAGGPASAFERARPVFEALGTTIVHVGPAGTGQIAKACNQLVVAATTGAVAEALALARALGADPAKVRDAMLGGFAASRILEEHGARMLARNWQPGGAIAVHLKDRANVYAEAEASGLDLPVARAAFERIERFVEAGGGQLDQSAIYTLFDPE